MLNKLNELRNSKEEGFTLIELLVVIVIIGVLAAIALPLFMNQQKQAIRAGMKSDVRNLITSVSTYLVKHPTATNLDYRWAAGTSTKVLSTDPDFQNVIPSDPDTIIGVRRDAVSTSPGGSWDGYYVFAASMQASFNTTNYYYEYTSTTGQYTERNP